MITWRMACTPPAFEHTLEMLLESISGQRQTWQRTVRLRRRRGPQSRDCTMKAGHLRRNDRKDFVNEVTMLLLPIDSEEVIILSMS